MRTPYCRHEDAPRATNAAPDIGSVEGFWVVSTERKEYGNRWHMATNDLSRPDTGYPLRNRQCTGTRQDGERCQRAPIPGGTVCVMHGGATMATQMAARRRLLSLVDPSLEALEKALQCGEWPTVARVALGLLDRAGFGPTASLRIDDPARDFRDLSRDELRTRARSVLEKLAGENVDVVDAELVNKDAKDKIN